MKIHPLLPVALITLTALLTLPVMAGAEEAGPTKNLLLRPKAIVESPASTQHAPFLLQPGEPNLDLAFRPEDERMKASRSSCETSGHSLCYDSAEGKIVYKKTAQYMPGLPGMRPEHISLRRDRITFKYSFR